MKKILFVFLILIIAGEVAAQYEDTEKKGLNKENVFSGGSLSVSFLNNTFLIGGSPVLGYKLTRFLDAGIVANYQYVSVRDYNVFDDRLRQSTYGGGIFTRVYPINFIFVQAQLEHNFINQKYIPPSQLPGGYKGKTSANSVLVGGGYTSGRAREGNTPFFYLSILFDVSGNKNSPYTDGAGRTVPVIRAGFNIPLFQPK